MSLFRHDTIERASGKRALALPLLFVAGLWALKWAEEYFLLDLPVWGIVPGHFRGPEFFLAPLIHGDTAHLLSNSLPLIVLSAAILYLYPRAAFRVFTLVYLGTGLLVYFFARGGPHIGASGINYGLVCFIFFSGVLRREPPAIALSLLVTFLYGSMVWGVLPTDPNISWESHLSGALLGIAYAGMFRITHPPVRPPMMDDDEDFEYDSDADWRDYRHPEDRPAPRGDYFRGGGTPTPYGNPYRRQGLDSGDEY